MYLRPIDICIETYIQYLKQQFVSVNAPMFFFDVAQSNSILYNMKIDFVMKNLSRKSISMDNQWQMKLQSMALHQELPTDLNLTNIVDVFGYAKCALFCF